MTNINIVGIDPRKGRKRKETIVSGIGTIANSITYEELNSSTRII